MIDEQIILRAERLRDELVTFRQDIRGRYRNSSGQVGGREHREQAARLAETWLVELANDTALKSAIGPKVLSDLNVHFQRMLSFSEHSTLRSRYEAEVRSILNDYAIKVVLPLKQARGQTISITSVAMIVPDTRVNSAFLGQSFDVGDRTVNQCVCDVLESLGIKVATGEKPKAERISDKVKRLIEEQSIFVGIFTRRDKIARKSEWTTSAWVIDEKAYAVGRQKRLILLKEDGVNSIGGIQGDYEYIEFSRDFLERLAISLIQIFDLTNNGLKK